MSGVYRSWVCCPVEFYFLTWQLCKGLQWPVGVCTLHSELCGDSVTHMTGTDMTTVVGLFVFLWWEGGRLFASYLVVSSVGREEVGVERVGVDNSRGLLSNDLRAEEGAKRQ